MNALLNDKANLSSWHRIHPRVPCASPTGRPI